MRECGLGNRGASSWNEKGLAVACEAKSREGTA